MSDARVKRRGRLTITILAATAALLLPATAVQALPTTTVAAAASGTSAAALARASMPDFGPNVTIFDPSMTVTAIKAKVDAISAQQIDAEMTGARYSLLFLPGTYGTAAQPLQFRVGYNTEVAGLGASPGDVVVHGKIEVYNRCIGADGSNCIALNNFWRTLSNLTLEIDATGQNDGCRASANFWAVSQAVSVRRLDVRTGEGAVPFSLMDYCTAGPQYASGGFIADSRFGAVVNGSQQQWLTRNSSVTSWSNGVWNQVFAGVEGAPSEANFPTDPYTTLDRTPVSREKPYLYVDAKGAWQVRVPSAVESSRGVSWAAGLTPGRSIPLRDFVIAKPGDSMLKINVALALGKHLLLTPGVYNVNRSIKVTRAGTVVLGMGQANLTSVGGAVPMTVADVRGAIVAGVTFDAGATESPVLLQVGSAHRHHSGHGHWWQGRWWHDRKHGAALDPITLSDVYFRVGGPHIGKVDTALRVDADDVLIDHTWVWRADHGVEGFTTGVNGDTDRWNTNIGRTGVVVTGDGVTATGFFVEHFQRENVRWEGEDGTVILFQNELPYDPPTQADWTQPDGRLGWPGYTVAPDVTTHALYGAGVYVFNQNNPAIVTENGFSVPNAPGVKLHHIMTVNLAAGTINHVVNGVGDPADNSNTGVPRFVTDYPSP